MKTFYLFASFIVVVTAALYFTNPDQTAFAEYMAEYVQTELADDTPGETEIGRKLRAGLGEIAGAAAERMATREDFQVASVYTIELMGDSHRFLGVAGQFFPLGKE